MLDEHDDFAAHSLKVGDVVVFRSQREAPRQYDSLSVVGEVTVTPKNGGLFVITGEATSTGFISGPIPEPGTWTMMILGLGASGAVLRRRQSRSGLARA